MGKKRENSLLQIIVEIQKKELERLEKAAKNPAPNMKVYANTKGKTDWATAKTETIAELLEDHYAGKLSIYDYFGIGDEREIKLTGEINQTIQMVLTDKEFYDLTDRDAKCAFTVDQKNLLKDIYLPMNKNGENVGGWKKSDMRRYVNGIYADAFPKEYEGIFKRFKLENDVVDLFTLRSEVEIFGEHIYSNRNEPGKQIGYYKKTRNRVKCERNDFGSAYIWWERSPCYGSSSCFCRVSSDGTAGLNSASSSLLIAPAGCI